MLSRSVLVLVALTGSLVAAEDPKVETPSRSDGWIDLMKPDVWTKYDSKWIATDDVKVDPEKSNRLAASRKDEGKVWVNGPAGGIPDLITKDAYGDCEVHVEFLIAKNSNSGIKLHAVYEIQIFDSFESKNALTGRSMGGIYPRADTSSGYNRYIDQGIAPKANAAKPPGEWQTLDVVWRSPRFNDKGEKSSNAVVVKAVLNGTVIHENLELRSPTGANAMKKEAATGPLMLQGDHGPVAFRNVKIKPAK